MRRMHRLLIACVVTLSCCLAGTKLAWATGITPQISSISDPVLHRSGRMLVFGTSFGSPTPGSQLLIDGSPAIVTSWLDNEIHGYVPEGAATSTVPVQVITAGGSSNTVDLDVTLRSSDGRVRWRFQTDSSFSGNYVTMAADGTIYTSDAVGLYAISPDGALLWFQPAGRGGRQIAVGDDGTIYTSMVAAINPDGTVKWQFDPPNPYSAQIAGPAVGSDGNVYAVQNTFNGLGVFSLDPAGSLRWSDIPDPAFNADLNNSKIEFGDPALGRFYFSVVSLRSGPWPATYGYDFDGDQELYQDSTCGSGPTFDGQFRMIMARGGVCGITALDEDGNEIWNAPPEEYFTFSIGPAVGPDGSVYDADWTGGELWSVDANGNTRWFLDGDSSRGLMQFMGVTPDNRLLLDNGRLTFGVPGWVKAYSTVDGSPQWQVDLPRENGFDQQVFSLPTFSSDGRTNYALTQFFGDGPGYAYLYALDVSDDSPSRSSYGHGWPGTAGIPSLTARNDPVLGSPLTLDIDNSLGAPTSGWMFAGVESASSGTPWGGTFLVTPRWVITLSLPASGLAMTGALPADPNLDGLSVYLQMLELDPGASDNVSFTPGLELTLGMP